MRRISGIIVVLTLAGCAATQPTLAKPPTDAQIELCREEARTTTTSAWTKGLIWASNIIVVPVTLGMLVVSPRRDEDRYGEYYWSCLERLDRENK